MFPGFVCMWWKKELSGNCCSMRQNKSYTSVIRQSRHQTMFIHNSNMLGLLSVSRRNSDSWIDGCLCAALYNVYVCTQQVFIFSRLLRICVVWILVREKNNLVTVKLLTARHNNWMHALIPWWGVSVIPYHLFGYWFRLHVVPVSRGNLLFAYIGLGMRGWYNNKSGHTLLQQRHDIYRPARLWHEQVQEKKEWLNVCN